MRLLIWTEQFWPYIGGLEVLTTRFAIAMHERGHEVHVVTSHGHKELPDEETHRGVKIHRFRFFEAISTRNVEMLFESRQRLTKLKKTIKPDLVHIATISPSVFFHVQTAAAAPCPCIVTQQLATLPGQQTGTDTILGQVLEDAVWVTCCSQSLLDETRRIAPAITPRSTVIYNGVEQPNLEPTPLPTDPPSLLCVGRLVPEKGFDVALRALLAVRETHPDVRLTIAGDGPSRDQLTTLAQELGLSDAVTLAGWVAPEDIWELMNTSTAVLIPSRAEAFGLVAAEAALMSRPVVAADVGGLPEVVENDETGILIPVDEPRHLAQAVLRLLEDPSTMTRMGQQARQRAARLFTWNSHVDAYEALYSQCMRAETTGHAAAS